MISSLGRIIIKNSIKSKPVNHFYGIRKSIVSQMELSNSSTSYYSLFSTDSSKTTSNKEEEEDNVKMNESSSSSTNEEKKETEKTTNEEAKLNQETETKETPEQIIKRLTTELKDSKDHMLRALAESENTRQIAQRDVKNARTYAVQSFAKQLLDVSDNLQRAIDCVPEDVKEHPEIDPHLDALYKGVSMTNTELRKVFNANGITEFGEVGDEFNPHKHEAMFQMPSDGTLKPNTIGQLLKSGYMFKDRVLRPAQCGTVIAAPSNTEKTE